MILAVEKMVKEIRVWGDDCRLEEAHDKPEHSESIQPEACLASTTVSASSLEA